MGSTRLGRSSFQRGGASPDDQFRGNGAVWGLSRILTGKRSRRKDKVGTCHRERVEKIPSLLKEKVGGDGGDGSTSIV